MRMGGYLALSLGDEKSFLGPNFPMTSLGINFDLDLSPKTSDDLFSQELYFA